MSQRSSPISSPGCCLDYFFSLCRGSFFSFSPLFHLQLSAHKRSRSTFLTIEARLKWNVEFVFNSTLYMHAHIFVVNPTCLSPASLLWTKTSLSQHPINSLNECITHVVSQLHSSHCHSIQHKTRSDSGVITYLANVPLRVNNIEGVSRAFA